MYRYRLIFAAPGLALGGALDAEDVESERVYAVGDVIERADKRWVVTQVPLEDPDLGATADLLLWPSP